MYVLPYTTTPPPSSPPSSLPTWQRSSTSILLANHQLHAESLAVLYGSRNVFALAVTFKQLTFRLRYKVRARSTTAAGAGAGGGGGGFGVRQELPLTPSSTLDFPGAVGGMRAVAALRHVVVLVERADEYEGMIKYNCGGRELVEGVRRQVRLLVRILSSGGSGGGSSSNNGTGRRLGSVEIRLESAVAAGRNMLRPSRSIGDLFKVARNQRRAQMEVSAGGRGVRQEVLEPFAKLRAQRAIVSGEGVDRAFAERLERRIMGEEDEEEDDMSILEEALPLPTSLENRIRRGETKAPLLARLPDG